MDETPQEQLQEGAVGVELGAGVCAAYTVPAPKPADDSNTVSDTQASLDELMAQMKAI